MSNLLTHAHRELDAVRQLHGDDSLIDVKTGAAILNVVEGFAGQGHSGGSAGYAGPALADTIRRLLAFEPLAPLTGADAEWMAITEDIAGRPGLEQNVRCSHVFREGGIAYDIEAVVFRDWRGGGAFTGWDSARRVTFPYTPSSRRTRFRWLSRTWARLRGQLRPR